MLIHTATQKWLLVLSNWRQSASFAKFQFLNYDVYSIIAGGSSIIQN